MTELRVLVVDDEQPALDELAWLLGRDDRVGDISCCDSSTAALRVLREKPFDALFVDIEMPGLSGLELAEVLARFKKSPQIVFVTAHAEHAVEAFDINAVDYVLKPVREERLREAVRRICEEGTPAPQDDETIPVELGGITRFLFRSQIQYAEAQGDYTRLHTAEGSHLVRLPISILEERWAEAGFVRIHRSLLIALNFVDEVRVDRGRCQVVIGDHQLQVSRRQTPVLRELLRGYRQDDAPGSAAQR